MRIKGPRGDQFFINRESVVRYAEELRQIEAIAAFGDEARHDVPQHAAARNSAPVRDMTVEAIAPTPQREPEEADAVRRLKDENLNLRIDNRAKETGDRRAQSAAQRGPRQVRQRDAGHEL